MLGHLVALLVVIMAVCSCGGKKPDNKQICLPQSVVVIRDANIREYPDASSGVVSVARSGEVLPVITKFGDFAEVFIPSLGDYGYVWSKAISNVSTVKIDTKIRTLPFWDISPSGVLAKGDEVRVLRYVGGIWYCVDRNGKIGWISEENVDEIY